MQTHRPSLILIALLVAGGCTQSVETAKSAGEVSRQAIADTRESWRNLFTYNPKRTTPQLPQTRYCYQVQSDIICYDSPQANTTARLVGYQDGASISWVQPGGGSLGVSGGEPTAPHDAQVVQVAPTVATPAQSFSTATSTTSVVETPQPPATQPFSHK